jgi:FkbM family methyltransferase
MATDYAYYAGASLKTRILNVLRRIFQWRPLETLLAAATQGRPTSSFAARLVPHEYLYRKGSWRSVERQGFRWRLDLGDAVDHYIFFGTAEPGFDRMFSFIKADSVILDVGANIGMLTMPFARAAGRGHVWSFEPDPNNRARLAEHVGLNALGNVTVLPVGLGERSGSFELYKVVASNSGMNRILQGTAADPALPHATIHVERLDDLWPTLGAARLDVMKIDVEGFEFSVLRGARATIERFQPVLFIELVDGNLRENGASAAELVAWLSSLDYSILEAESGRPLDPLTLADCRLDVLALPARS